MSGKTNTHNINPTNTSWNKPIYKKKLEIIVDIIFLIHGTPGENRTPDALLRTEALYPLSYGGRDSAFNYSSS